MPIFFVRFNCEVVFLMINYLIIGFELFVKYTATDHVKVVVNDTRHIIKLNIPFFFFSIEINLKINCRNVCFYNRKNGATLKMKLDWTMDQGELIELNSGVLGRDFIHVAVGIQKKFFGLPQRQMCAST
jgi:hypothetical protein